MKKSHLIVIVGIIVALAVIVLARTSSQKSLNTSSPPSQVVNPLDSAASVASEKEEVLDLRGESNFSNRAVSEDNETGTAQQITFEICNDAIDNDNDGFVDEDDFDCEGDAAKDVITDLEDPVTDVDVVVSNEVDDSSSNPSEALDDQDDVLASAYCGADHGQVLAGPPQNTLCLNGTSPTQQTGSGPWRWACVDGSDSVLEVCEARASNVDIIIPLCGETPNACDEGILVDTDDSNAEVLWGCIGSGGSDNLVTCSIPK